MSISAILIFKNAQNFISVRVHNSYSNPKELLTILKDKVDPLRISTKGIRSIDKDGNIEYYSDRATNDVMRMSKKPDRASIIEILNDSYAKQAFIHDGKKWSGVVLAYSSSSGRTSLKNITESEISSEEIIKSIINESAETYHVYVAIGQQFDDVYVKAKSEEEAIQKAKKETRLKNHTSFRWAKFVVG